MDALDGSFTLYEQVMRAVPDDMRPQPDESGLDRAFADLVTPVWSTFDVPLNRYLAGKAFASWTAYQGRGVMNIRQVYPPSTPDPDVIDELGRIMELWAQARARFGGDGDFLFGAFGAVDIMFAPVVTRIVTYSLPVPRFAQSYMLAVLQHPFMQDWIAAAQEEDWVIEQFEKPASG